MDLDLDGLFQVEDLCFHPDSGIVRDRLDHRVWPLSRVALQSLRVVAGQTGDERLFFHRWGAVQAGMTLEDWNDQLRDWADITIDTISVATFLELFSRHFALCGWGRFHFDLQPLPEAGFMKVGLTGSLFSETFEEPFSDWPVVGLLGELFGTLSGQRLRALQVRCPVMGDSESHFLISDAERIRPLEKLSIDKRREIQTPG